MKTNLLPWFIIIILALLIWRSERIIDKQNDVIKLADSLNDFCSAECDRYYEEALRAQEDYLQHLQEDYDTLKYKK